MRIMKYKKGDIIINPWYSIGHDSEESQFYMLCKIESIITHKHRFGGIAFRLVTIAGNHFITNSSERMLDYVQKTPGYEGLPYKHPY